MFGLLVSLNFSLPSLFNGEGPAPLPSCNIQDNHILRLVFLAHITLIMFAAAASWPAALRPDFCHCPPAKECVALLDLLPPPRRAVLLLPQRGDGAGGAD